MNELSRYKFLPLTLSIETVGGIATPLMNRGTPLPAVRKQRFSTAAEGQKVVTISIFYGESPIAKKNIHLGKFDLENIPEGPRGEAEVDIQFEVDDRCQLAVKASSTKSGKIISSTEKRFEPQVTVEKVEEFLRKAIDEKNEDQTIARSIEAKNSANSLIAQAEKYLLGQQKYGLRNAVDTQIEETIAALGLAFQDDNIGMIEDKSKRLRELIPKTDVDFGMLFGGASPFEGFFGAPPQPRKKAPAQPKAQEKRTTAASPSEEIAKPREGVFSAGQHFDAKRIVRDLFAVATTNIVVIDAYLGEDVLNLLTVKKDGVHAKLLTGKVSPAFLTLARNFNRQYRNLEIRSSKAFHDRFIFIDDKELYHFGASLEHLGNKTFMFSKIEEPMVIAALKGQWDASWGQASVVL